MKGRDCARGNDDVLEFSNDWRHRDRRIQAPARYLATVNHAPQAVVRELDYGIRHIGVALVERLNQDAEALRVGPQQRRKVCYERDGNKVRGISHLKRSEQRAQPRGAEAQRAGLYLQTHTRSNFYRCSEGDHMIRTSST